MILVIGLCGKGFNFSCSKLKIPNSLDDHPKSRTIADLGHGVRVYASLVARNGTGGEVWSKMDACGDDLSWRRLNEGLRNGVAEPGVVTVLLRCLYFTDSER